MARPSRHNPAQMQLDFGPHGSYPEGRSKPGFVKGGSRVDLHTHTRRSDGVLRTGELLEEAKASGVKVLGITDHDVFTTDDQRQRAREKGIYLVPGTAELNAYWKNPQRPNEQVRMHVIPSWVSPEARMRIHRILSQSDHMRVEQAMETLEMLSKKGLSIENVDMRRIRDGRNITKGDIARMMFHDPSNKKVLEQQGIRSPEQFRGVYMLGGKSPLTRYNVPYERIWEGLGEDGYLTIAHPAGSKTYLADADLDAVARLGDPRRLGIETYYAYHRPQDIARLRQFARRRGLATTIGSDFHQERKTRLPLKPADAEAEWAKDIRDSRGQSDLSKRLDDIYRRIVLKEK